MKIANKFSVLLVLAVVLVFAGQSVVYGAAGVDDTWAENPTARGTRANGPLVPSAGFGTDPNYVMHFFLRVKYQGELHMFTGVSPTLLQYPADLGGDMTMALHDFLKKVTVHFEPGWASCTPDPFNDGVGPTAVACPNILRNFDNDYVDSELSPFDGDILSIITNVKLRIPSPPE